MVVLSLGTNVLHRIARLKGTGKKTRLLPAGAMGTLFGVVGWLACRLFVKMALSAKISNPITTTPHNQPTPSYATMSLENLLPLGKATMKLSVRMLVTDCCRTHRQMRRFADLGHYEWRKRCVSTQRIEDRKKKKKNSKTNKTQNSLANWLALMTTSVSKPQIRSQALLTWHRHGPRERNRDVRVCFASSCVPCVWANLDRQ